MHIYYILSFIAHFITFYAHLLHFIVYCTFYNILCTLYYILLHFMHIYYILCTFITFYYILCTFITFYAHLLHFNTFYHLLHIFITFLCTLIYKYHCFLCTFMTWENLIKRLQKLHEILRIHYGNKVLSGSRRVLYGMKDTSKHSTVRGTSRDLLGRESLLSGDILLRTFWLSRPNGRREFRHCCVL